MGIIFTDGASSGNPGPGGWAAILLMPDGQVKELGGREPHTTNNQMELTAAIRALEYLEKEHTKISEPFQIYTDSTYVIQGATLWASKWEKRGWKTTDGNPVANLDLWKQLNKLLRSQKLEWHLVKGHAGVPGNERADEIAVEFSLNRYPSLYSGPSKSYPIDLLDLRQRSEPPSKKNSNRGSTPYSYLSLVDQIPKRHSDWKSCELRVKGKSGARFKKAMSADEEAEILKSWGFKLEDLNRN